ncbi:MAG: hypothetical protein U0350_26770 [Caldilineaceae bacterium]
MPTITMPPANKPTTLLGESAENILQRLQRLPQAAWPDLLRFIEFLEYKWDIMTEDEALWQAVQDEKAYRQAHPEDVIICESVEDLARALGDEG